MSDHISWKDRFAYWRDNLFSRGAAAMIAALFTLSLVIIIIAAIAVTLGGQATAPGNGETVGFWEAFWMSMMRSFDAGTMGGDTGWGFRFAMLFVTVGGIFVISSLIGVLTTGLEAKMDELRKGRSRVLENNHTVILGWSEQVFTIISELVIANENQPRACIVILGDKDKIEMEDEIRAKAGSTGKTRIVCRSGSPMEMSNLSIVNLNMARSIIVVSPDSDDPDSEVIKTILAILNHPTRRPQPYHIVAEIRDVKNMDVARVVGKKEVEWVLVGDLVARIIAQTCRQSGLSVIYTELLDFGGDEIYFKTIPELVGKAFGESLNYFEKNTVLGIFTAGRVSQLNPPMDTVLQAGDQLMLIAEDDDKIFVTAGGPGRVEEALIHGLTPRQAEPERNLILGWNWRGGSILRELDRYVAPGSRVLVVADEDEIEEKLDPIRAEMHNQEIVIRRADTTDRRVLDSLDLDHLEHIILLCYSDSLGAQKADARTLISLLHLREIADRRLLNFSIVSEMLDVRNRDLASVTRADDFIVSDKLVSLMLAQVSENPLLNAVFADIFDPEGSEIYLKPIADYVDTGKPVNFYTIVEAARRRGEVALGYRLLSQSNEASLMYGVHLNPAKSQPVSFAKDDKLIVAAES